MIHLYVLLISCRNILHHGLRIRGKTTCWAIRLCSQNIWRDQRASRAMFKRNHKLARWESTYQCRSWSCQPSAFFARIKISNGQSKEANWTVSNTVFLLHLTRRNFRSSHHSAALSWTSNYPFLFCFHFWCCCCRGRFLHWHLHDL